MIVDPMLATGGSAIAAIDMVKKQGAKISALSAWVWSSGGCEGRGRASGSGYLSCGTG